jgi:azurin
MMRIIAIITILGFLFSCGGSSASQETSNETTTTETADKTTSETSTEEAIADTARLTIEGNDLMQFNKDLLEVYEGQVVELTLKHVGEMSVEAMGHNWVLLTQGTDKSTFGNAAVSAKANGYIPQDMEENVIAYTKTIGGGESTTITFDAPSAGYYDFLCSFPGHYGVMQGSFTVKPR